MRRAFMQVGGKHCGILYREYLYNQFEIAHPSRSGYFSQRSPLATCNNYTRLYAVRKYLIRLIQSNKRNCVILIQVYAYYWYKGMRTYCQSAGKRDVRADVYFKRISRLESDIMLWLLYLREIGFQIAPLMCQTDMFIVKGINKFLL